MIARILFTLPAFVMNAISQAVSPRDAFWSDPFNHPMLPVYAVTALVFAACFLTALVAVYMAKVLNIFSSQARAGESVIQRSGWWTKAAARLNASVPLADEKSIELDHNYDGIRELDNHLPPWWRWLFYGTIGFAAVYMVVFHLSGSLPLQEQEYQQELAAAEEQALKFKASRPAMEVDENTLAFTNDPLQIEQGRTVFMNNNCGSCHRNDGGGNAIGPNLTDEYWIHGGDISQIFRTIRNGAVEKGMPAWGKAMSPQDVRDVTFFVMSLQGTNPADSKAPQGQLFKPASIASDSARVQASL